MIFGHFGPFFFGPFGKYLLFCRLLVAANPMNSLYIYQDTQRNAFWERFYVNLQKAWHLSLSWYLFFYGLLFGPERGVVWQAKLGEVVKDDVLIENPGPSWTRTREN